MSWDLDRDYVKGVFCDDDGSWSDIDHRIDNIMAALNRAYRERDDARDSNRRAAVAVREMWRRRYDTDDIEIPDPHSGEPFGSPVAVDLGLLAVAHFALIGGEE